MLGSVSLATLHDGFTTALTKAAKGFKSSLGVLMIDLEHRLRMGLWITDETVDDLNKERQPYVEAGRLIEGKVEEYRKDVRIFKQARGLKKLRELYKILTVKNNG